MSNELRAEIINLMSEGRRLKAIKWLREEGYSYSESSGVVALIELAEGKAS